MVFQHFSLFDSLTVAENLILGLDENISSQINIESQYYRYLKRQAADIDAYKRDESLLIPADLDYSKVGGLSTEARLKLQTGMPLTLGAASRGSISGRPNYVKVMKDDASRISTS